MMSSELRELPEGWKWKKLNEVCNRRRSTLDPKENLNEKYAYYSFPAFDKGKNYVIEQGNEINSRKRVLKTGDVLISRLNPRIQRITIVEEEKLTKIGSTEYVALELKEDNLLNKYLYYYLFSNSVQTYLKNLISGSTKSRARVSYSQVMEISIPIPPLKEQEEIVNQIDELISNLEVIYELQQEADKIGKNIMNATISSVLKLNKVENDDIELPIGWKLKTLGDVTNESRYGYTAKAKKNIDGVPYLRITDINDDGSLEENGFKYVDVEDEVFKKYSLKKGDIVIARSGATVGKNYLYGSKDLKMVFASYLIRFRLNKNMVLPKYIYYYLNSHKYWYFINRKKRGGAQPNINANELKKLEIPIPPISEQKRMIAKLDGLKSSIEMIENEIKNRDNLLTKLPQSILKKAFAGEL